MTMLLIETCTERSLAGIYEAGKLLFCAQLPIGLNSSKFIMSEIQRGMDKLGFQMSCITSIAVGVGPGSYTGIRVGAIIAKTLAFALKVPVVGIPTLESFLPQTEGAFAVMLDARSGGVYMLRGAKTGEKMIYKSTSELIPTDQIEHALQDVELIVTPFAEPFRAKLRDFKEFKWQECGPDPIRMAAVALTKKEAEPLELLYLRKTQAEIEKTA